VLVESIFLVHNSLIIEHLTEEAMVNRSKVFLIAAAVSLMVIGLSYWTGFLSLTDLNPGSEILVITNPASRRVGENLYLAITIRNLGAKDAELEYIVANGTVVDEENHVVPRCGQIDIEIPLDSEANSLLIMRLHTSSGNDFEQSVIVPQTT
jgi:hypothetical protein